MSTDPPAGIDPDTWEAAVTAMTVASWDSPPSLWRSERDVMLRAALAVLGSSVRPADAAVHSLLPESTWTQHAIRHPDGSVYDSFDGTLAAAQRLASRVEGSRIVVREHAVGPWTPVEATP